MFHAATAALLTKDIVRHSHQGIISSFGREFIKTGQVEQKFHKYFAEAFDLRQQSDYQPVVEITHRQANNVVEMAKEFVEACRNLCK
jgi:uncharacterized protein (UPF0332 family)